ncbi:MAG: hypothetical protein J4F41_10030, partial [Alphaproteobacteria bacterium]|nr:hypothetical protein [Alphaproteobacteria bacterium]
PAVLELTRRESRRIDVMAGDHHTIDHRAIDHRAMIADVACHLKAGRKLVYLTPTPQPKLDDALLAMAGVAVDVLPYVAPHDVALPYVAPHDVAPPHEGPSYGEMPSPPLDGGFALLPDHAATSPRYMSPRELLPHQKRII